MLPIFSAASEITPWQLRCLILSDRLYSQDIVSELKHRFLSPINIQDSDPMQFRNNVRLFLLHMAESNRHKSARDNNSENISASIAFGIK